MTDPDDPTPDIEPLPFARDVLDKALRDLNDDDAHPTTVGEVRQLLTAVRRAAERGPRYHKDYSRCYDVTCPKAHTIGGFTRWGGAP